MIEFTNEDCMIGMARYPDNCIDLIVTDPPYKMNHSTGGCTNIGFKNKWQGKIKAGNTVMDFNTDIQFHEWIPQTYRLLKSGGHAYIFVNDKNMQELLEETQNAGYRLSNILVWKKNNCTPNRYYMKACEFIVFLYKDFAKPINNMETSNVLEVTSVNGKDKWHPTEKPVELIRTILLNSSNHKDIVLDPFVGGGSTALACLETERKFIGFELDNKYYRIAKQRLDDFIRQPRIDSLSLNCYTQQEIEP